jgi:hypothetical protein
VGIFLRSVGGVDWRRSPGGNQMIMLEAYLITSFASCLFYVVRSWRIEPAMQHKGSKNGKTTRKQE